MSYICLPKVIVDFTLLTPSMKKITLACLLAFLMICCSDKAIRVACIGDSITEGAGLADQSRTSYPVYLNAMLGKHYAVLNSGRGGTTLQKKGDFSYWTTKEFANTFAFNPEVIVIKLGTNDTKPQNWNPGAFEEDYQALIDTLKTLSAAPKLYLCLPVPVYRTEWGINDSTLVQGVLPLIRKMALKNKLELIDLNQGLANRPEMFPDYIHPNERGTNKIACIVAKSIQGK
jgi:alpha-L-fucosidase 2